MKCTLVLCFIALIYISSCLGHDLIVGTTYNGHLTWQQKAEYMGIPFKKRVKEIFYSDPAQNIIKGVVARDIDHTEGSAIVTAGGVGFSFVNVRFKSARGSGLNYQLEIYI